MTYHYDLPKVGAPWISPFTMASIRAVVAPDFEQSPTLDGLRKRLRERGFRLKSTATGLYLATDPQGVLVCPVHHLGPVPNGLTRQI